MNDQPDDTDMDWTNARRQAPSKKARAVVSVAFSKHDFDRLDQHAERLGVRLSEYIRTATLARITADEEELRSGVSTAAYYAPAPKIDVNVQPTPTHAEQHWKFLRRVA